MSDLDPLDIHGQEQAEEERKLFKTLISDQEIADFKWLMSDKRGRRFMWTTLEKTGVYRLSYNGDSNDTIFCEGGRNVGLRLIAMIHDHCPGRYNEMITEQKDYDDKLNSKRRTSTK